MLDTWEAREEDLEGLKVDAMRAAVEYKQVRKTSTPTLSVHQSAYENPQEKGNLRYSIVVD